MKRRECQERLQGIASRRSRFRNFMRSALIRSAWSGGSAPQRPQGQPHIGPQIGPYIGPQIGAAGRNFDCRFCGSRRHYDCRPTTILVASVAIQPSHCQLPTLSSLSPRPTSPGCSSVLLRFFAGFNCKLAGFRPSCNDVGLTFWPWSLVRPKSSPDCRVSSTFLISDSLLRHSDPRRINHCGEE